MNKNTKVQYLVPKNKYSFKQKKFPIYTTLIYVKQEEFGVDIDTSKGLCGKDIFYVKVINGNELVSTICDLLNSDCLRVH
jgi:hypothetical protein